MYESFSFFRNFVVYIYYKVDFCLIHSLLDAFMKDKRYFSTVILSLAFSVSAMAQSYSSLWKQFDKARDKDLPKSELSILEQIRDKAQEDRAYGQLLKSELQMISVQSSVSPDSLAPQLKRYERMAADANDAVLSAVYNSTLGHIYRDWWRSLDMRQDSAQVIARRYYKQSLHNPQLLASTKAGTYDPLVVTGDNSSVFGNDLLHVLAMEAEDYDLMSDYYQKVGNRPAACISAYYKTQKDRMDDVRLAKKSKYLATIDSLINVYKDLPEAGELAIEHFNFLDGATDASAKEKVEYIDYALLNWPTWPRMAVLKNARSRITLPSFNACVSKSLSIPGHEIPVYITSLTHIDKLKMDVYKVNITGADDFNPNDANDYKMLRTRMSEKPVWSDDRVYYGLPEYLVVRDTMRIAPLPVGVYMVEFTTDNADVAVERLMIHISNLRLVSMNLPDNRMRMAVLDATTGKPVAGAKINIKFGAWQNHKWVEDQRTLVTEEDGEMVFSSTLAPREYLLTTDEDKAFPWQHIGNYTWRGNTSQNTTATNQQVRLFSDRKIYRPGQKVKMSVLAYDVYSREQWQAAEKCNVHLVLRNSKQQKVAEKDVTTDEWGVASAEFDLPEDGTTGYNYIQAKVNGSSMASYMFRVEEYKRPAFSVTIDDYKDAYKEGDTINVKGWAKTYSGVAVQNAKVAYKVKSVYRAWCWRVNMDDNEYYEGEAVTGNDGSFCVKVPVKMPDENGRGNRFAAVIMDATVTDKAGESHSASASYPVSDKPAAFALTDFSDKQCKESQKPFSFMYVNNAGQKIDSEVTYSIDASAPVKVKANADQTLDLSGISSGSHLLKAYCGNDTLTQKFIVFSLKDTKAPVDTVAWYYSTTGDNSTVALKGGKTEYIQIGTSAKDQTVLYTVVSDTTVIETGQMVLNNEVKTRTVEYKEEWGDGIAIRYAWARDGELYTYEQRYARPTQENTLVMEWKTFRDRLAPGQKEEWTMTVKNADGTPAKAQVMAVMYDKSLDALSQHGWNFNHVVSYNPPTIMQQATYNISAMNIYGEQTFRPLQETDLQFSHLDIPQLIYAVDYGGFSSIQMLDKKPMLLSKAFHSANTLDSSTMSDNVALSKVATTEGSTSARATEDTTSEQDNVPMRENLNETAFFMPQLVTDKWGNVSVKFTLPECLTTWRVMTLSHDKQMNTGSMEAEVIAQKKLMIQPNMPRFIREGDKAQMSAIITNNQDRDMTGKAYVQILRSADEKVMAKVETPFSVKAGQQTNVTFSLPANLASDVYICRVVAQSSNFSDGEQHLLPVLSDKVEVTTTKAFTQTKAGEKVIDLKALYGTNASKESLKVEYTNNPAWLMIEALPVVANPEAENAISLAVALYANSITDGIKSQMPVDTTATKAVTTERLIGQLANLQNVNGSFSWYDGMQPSLYVTQSVAKILARMKHLGIASASVRPMLNKAMAYLDVQMAEYVARLKRQAKDSKTKPSLSDTAYDYLYIQTVSGNNMDATATANASYLLSLVDKSSAQFSIYGKANMAVISALHPVKKNKSLAKQLLESVRQYTVQTEEMGRYFDTPKASYSWCDYKIPTQTAAIEALQTLTPDDKLTIADMQQWLLQEKRTQQWNTPLNSASAIYAFFNGWDFTNKNNSVAEATANVESTRLYVDNKLIDGGKEVAGKGYVSQTLDGRHSSFRAVKTSDNISWGAVYATCTQPVSDVKEAGESLSVKREILDEKGNKLTAVPQVGQKVTVRLTLVAKRDLDFVEVTDNRAACLEPVVQTSGYAYGYYEAPRDNKTIYCYDKLAKGKHVIETAYYVDRAGNYTSGTVTAKCMYAPEYQAHDKALNVETK